MILYPTETQYALGVNALDASTLQQLYKAKDRPKNKVASWLVRDISDIEQFAHLTEVAKKIAQHFLPGQLTLVLRVHDDIAADILAEDRTIGFRISSDAIAQKIIDDFYTKHEAPLTCTSANVSGAPTLPTPGEILQQFGSRAFMIDEIVDDGPRKGLASTVVRVVDDAVTVLREGEISESEISTMLASNA